MVFTALSIGDEPSSARHRFSLALFVAGALTVKLVG